MNFKLLVHGTIPKYFESFEFCSVGNPTNNFTTFRTGENLLTYLPAIEFCALSFFNTVDSSLTHTP